MRLHLLSIPHTVTTPEASHCAFTGKVQKFPKMMEGLDYEIIHYGVEGAVTDANVHIDLMTQEEQSELRGHDGSDTTRFVGDDADIGTPLYKEFNKRLRVELLANVNKQDIVLMPMGWAHGEAVADQPWTKVESGIGYPTLYDHASARIFESYAWMHWHKGKMGAASGLNYEWVIPNYFDVSEWDYEPEPDMNRVVFLGRIDKCKGLETVVALAHHRPDLQFEICGQGPGGEWASSTPNITYVPPINGRARSAYLGNARACLMPTNFIEPFGGVAVEAMMCGTPVLSTSYGAFTETIEDQSTGFRCHTFGDWLAGLEKAKDLDREAISNRAKRLYGYDRVGLMYDRAFRQLYDLHGAGWNTKTSVFGPAVSKQVIAPRWDAAQEAEAKFHADPGGNAYEERKRLKYASMLGINTLALAGRPRVIDMGSGPQGLVGSYASFLGQGSTALDPLEFGEDYEQAYRDAGIERVVCAAEDFETEEHYNETWIYNVLQHVKDPLAFMAKAREVSDKVRIWEWCNVPMDTCHIHVITRGMVREGLVVDGWRVVDETHGQWRQGDMGHDEFYCLIVEREF